MKNVLKIKNPSTGEFEPIAAISGADGKPGKDGQGVPTGGTVGQVLRKTGSGDYEAAWSDSAGDSEKLGGVAAAQYARKNDVPAHNLLDNSDFTNPVNQRGATTATLGKYFIDRWSTEPYPSGPSITIDSNGLTLLPTTSSTAGIYQTLPDYENRKGKVHTFAICVNNVWKCVSFTMGNFGVGYLIHGLSFFSVDKRNILIRNNASDTPAPITIQRVALYEGSYDASTLPAYQPKGYAAELAECQRYYIKYTSDSTIPMAVAAKVSNTVCRATIMMATTMRTKYPTINAYGCNISGVEITSIGSAGIVGNGILLTLNCDASSLAYNTTYCLSVNSGEYIEISADL